MRFPRAIFLFVIVTLVTVAIPVAAWAQDVDEIADAIRDDGVYVDSGLSISEAQVGEYVSTVRNEGEALSIVILFDEPVGGATTFADAVFNRLGSGVVLVIAAESDGYSGILEEYGDTEFDEALEMAANGAESDTEFLEIFVAELTGLVPATSGAASDGGTATATPTTVAAAAEPDSGGGGLGFLFWIILIGGGIFLFFWWRRRRAAASGPKLDPQMVEAKDRVQEQINAVANDIIDMEDEVRVADDDRADEFYQQAGATYTDVVEAFPEANSPEALLDLANKLDEAIWQLDSAEAVLDGRSLPPRPRPQRMPVPEPAAPGRPSPVPGGSSLPPRPDYDRRPSRRSSYGGGGGLMNILMGMAGAMMANRASTPARRAPARRAPTPMFPPVPTKRSPIPTPSSPRAGSRRAGTPSSTSTRTRTRRGSTGRSRGGVRRGRRRRR